MPDRLTLLITANEPVYLGIAYMHSAPRAVSSISGIYRCGMRNVENNVYNILHSDNSSKLDYFRFQKAS